MSGIMRKRKLKRSMLIKACLILLAGFLAGSFLSQGSLFRESQDGLMSGMVRAQERSGCLTTNVVKAQENVENPGNAENLDAAAENDTAVRLAQEIFLLPHRL